MCVGEVCTYVCVCLVCVYVCGWVGTVCVYVCGSDGYLSSIWLHGSGYTVCVRVGVFGVCVGV